MTPVHVIGGFLGVGKTTAVLDLLARGGLGDRPSVLVNDFGTIGVDAARMSGAVEVREVPGGCICCAGAVPLRVALVRLFRELRPDRVLIEPSGAARLDAVLDVLRSPGLREGIDVRATITLVDPSRTHASDPEILERTTAQIQASDVLVVNRADLADPWPTVAALAGRFPTPRLVAVTERGRLDPAWLALPSRGRTDFGPPSIVDLRTTPAVVRRAPETEDWIGALPAVPYARSRWMDAVHRVLVLPGVHTLRAVGRSERGWMQVEGTPSRVDVFPVAYRGDAVVEVGGRGFDRGAVTAILRDLEEGNA